MSTITTTRTVSGQELHHYLISIEGDFVGNGGYVNPLEFNADGHLEFSACVPEYGISKHLLIVPIGDKWCFTETYCSNDPELSSYPLPRCEDCDNRNHLPTCYYVGSCDPEPSPEPLPEPDLEREQEEYNEDGPQRCPNCNNRVYGGDTFCSIDCANSI